MQYGVILPQEYVEKKELAVACKRAGDYSRAIDLYWEVMQAYPADADQYKGRAKGVQRGNVRVEYVDGIVRAYYSRYGRCRM